MIVRSASMPTFDRHDCFSPASAASRSNRALFAIDKASQVCRSPKPSFAMRRACSEIDVQGSFCSEESCHPDFGCSLDNISTAFLLGCQLSASSKIDYLGANFEGGLSFRDGNGNENDGSGGSFVSTHGDADPTDLCYRQLLRMDPQNPLLLRNYAQFLSEIKHDYKKSEEYYERAILACPSDGEVLSTYAKHLWDVNKDAQRAGSYFDQAIKATPNDCYVLASHASFLWQLEEDGDSNDAALPLLSSSNSMDPTARSLTASA
ncbi:hypothetical protein L7F22_044742 [Adiantum nelumboides]|nr:hypothetical protein [Adiantum nelumboides]